MSRHLPGESCPPREILVASGDSNTHIWRVRVQLCTTILILTTCASLRCQYFSNCGTNLQIWGWIRLTFLTVTDSHHVFYFFCFKISLRRRYLYCWIITLILLWQNRVFPPRLLTSRLVIIMAHCHHWNKQVLSIDGRQEETRFNA